MDGEPLGDPFPWEPLFSPLNMVVKAGAGSGWARQAADSGLGGPQAAGGGVRPCWRLGWALARWGRRTSREGSFWKPLPAGEALAVAHAHTLAHTHACSCTTSLGGKGTAQKAGRPRPRDCPTPREGSDLLHPTGPESASSNYTQMGKQPGPAGQGSRQTDAHSMHTACVGSGTGPASAGLWLRLINTSNQHRGRVIRQVHTHGSPSPTPREVGPLPAGPGWAVGPGSPLTTRASRSAPSSPLTWRGSQGHSP